MSWNYKLGFFRHFCCHCYATDALEPNLMQLGFRKNIILLFFYPFLLHLNVLGLLFESHSDVSVELLHVNLLIA